MARNDDGFNIFEGIFWLTAAAFNYARPQVWLLFFLHAIPYLLGLYTLYSITEGTDGWMITIVPTIIAWVLRFFLKRSAKKSLESVRRTEGREKFLTEEYLQLTNDWILTVDEYLDYQGRTWSWQSKYGDFEKAQIAWRIWIAELAAADHASWESKRRNRSITPQQWIDRNKNLWVKQRVSILLPKFERITRFWVPSMAELQQDTIVPWRLTNASLLFYNEFDQHLAKARRITNERLSQAQADEEYLNRKES